MKKLLTILALAIGMIAGAQTYVGGSFSYYDGAGTFGQQSMATIEVGRSINDVATLGVAAGVTAFSGGRFYTEFRPTIWVWSKNRFSLGGTLGAGYVFNSSQSFMTEYCGTFYYILKGDKLGLSIFGGGYHFSGGHSASKLTFVGTGITYTIPKKP